MKKGKLLNSITRARLKLLYPDVAVKAIRVLNDFYSIQGRFLNCASGVRTFAKQQELYRKGRDAPGAVVTNAPPGYSFHNYGLALDVSFRGMDPYLDEETEKLRDFLWKRFGQYAGYHGFVWGGHFNGLRDRPHIQMTYGHTIREIREVYSAMGLPGVWARMDKIRGVSIGQDWAGPHARAKNVELRELLK